jgi:hypothetical protein
MDYRCPHCQESLSGRWLRARFQGQASHRSPFVCSECGAGLEMNIHPNEGRVSALAMLPLGFVMLAHAFGVQVPIPLVFIASASLVGGVAYEFYFYLVQHASWPRYRMVHAPNTAVERDASPQSGSRPSL